MFTFILLLNQNIFFNEGKGEKFKHAGCHTLLQPMTMFLVHACYKGKQEIVLFKEFHTPLSKLW